MRPLRPCAVVVRLLLPLLLWACNADPVLPTAQSDAALDSPADAAFPTDAGPPAADLTAPPADGDAPVSIATWSDAPGLCTLGSKRVELSSAAQIIAASRGDAPYNADPPATCYFIKDGVYNEGAQLLFWVKRGGLDGNPRLFVGQSRAGVIIHGRANVDTGADHVVFSNMTFDLTGFVKADSWNTFDIGPVRDVTLHHMTFTGDCKTGFRGGHIEVNGATNVLVESCLVEKFGHCGNGGHEDHGIYLASGRDITIRNCDIRGNSSRGILFNTMQGQYGTIRGVLVELCRIHDNGHGDYEDGIAVNMQQSGAVDDVTIRHNLLHGNYYSGIRFVGSVTRGFQITRNTFFGNGARSSGGGRSNLNLDDVGSGGTTIVTGNIFSSARALLNDCQDAAPRGFLVDDNVNNASAITTGAGGCVSRVISADPMFTDAAGGDFHARNPAIAGYGAY